MLVSRGLLISGESPAKIGVKNMFKSSRRRTDKNTITATFKLQFHASKLPHIGEDGLVISVVPADAGKPTVKSRKALVRDWSCLWENPVYMSVKFSKDTKSGKVHERIYYFIVGTSSSKSGVIGEVSIDFANYAEATKVSMVSLSLNCSKPEAVLNVSIQRMLEPIDRREFEEIEDAKSVYNESAKSNYKEHSLKAQMEKTDIERETIKMDSLIRSRNGEVNSDLSKTASNISDNTMSSSERENVHHERLKVSALETASMNGSLSTPRENEAFIGRQDHLKEEESSDIFIENLKNEVASLTRQVEMSELELQTLRKQIVKESKRGQDLFKEAICLKKERDSLKAECGRIKSANTRNNNMQSRCDCWETVEELRQELKHVKEINSSLQIQLQRTQESNYQLILAVRDLDEILEHKDKEISNGLLRNYTEPTKKENDDDDDDDEQKALEELVKENSDAKDAYFLERQIMDMHGEIEICKRDRDEMEMQMEQMVLDYEIMKQENHEMAYKLEQSKIQEQLKMQYECSTEYTTVQELENQLENLENELKRRSEESEIALAKISELEACVESIEEDLEKQSEGFGVDLESLMRLKVEQEQRAIRAEEALRKTKRQNANAAERIQEEFKKFSVQVGSTLKANEIAASKALAEAKELRLQKEIIEKASIEEKMVTKSMMYRIESMQLEIKDKALQLENQKKDAEETRRLLSGEISKLKDEISNQMKISEKKMELLLKKGDSEKTGLEDKITLLLGEAEELKGELNKMRSLVEEKELKFEKLQSELVSLQSECTELKNTVSEYGLEKDLLRKQLFLLNGDLKRNDDLMNEMEKKITPACYNERLKLFEDQIKSNESALETSYNAFLDKENELCNKIGELEGRLKLLNQVGIRCCEKMCGGLCLSSNGNSLPDSLKRCEDNSEHLDELPNEMGLLKERNRLMEVELKEMQERYSEISVKFAEVEGERQHLVMRVRNLKNAKLV